MSGVKRSIRDIQKFRAARFEHEIAERFISSLEGAKRLKGLILQYSRSHGDGFGMKLSGLYELMEGFPVLLGAREFDNIRKKCPFGKLFGNLESLPPAIELQRIQDACKGQRAINDAGVVFQWPYLKDQVILHTMQPDMSALGTQLTCRLADDNWLVLESLTRFISRLSSTQIQWDPRLKGKQEQPDEYAGSD